jgi:fructose/tagatose bisphosphate aldolase
MASSSLLSRFEPWLSVSSAGGVEVNDEAGLRRDGIDLLAREAVFGAPADRPAARWLIWEAAHQLGAPSASIHELYMARGRGEVEGFTVPAMNIRGPTYDVVRAAFRAAKASQVGAFIFEIAKSEMSYTDQTPEEYAAVVLAAAIKEGHKGPVFIQGDHFQFKADAYAKAPEDVTKGIENLTRTAIEGGFHNIDIDASTLVDLSLGSVAKQQALNADLTARLTAFIRSMDPEGMTISVGGEIGEVGKKNSTPEELTAYLDQLNQRLKKRAKGAAGISKVSVQTGTTHGGVPRPDGTVAEVDVDFDTIDRLSKICVESYGLAGVVQHGASTLPDDLFHKFPDSGAAEIHLATGFQNAYLDHPAFPADLKARMVQHLMAHEQAERAPGWTNEQFVYKTRKKVFGPFKKELWEMAPESKDPLMDALEQRFAFLFKELRVTRTHGMVAKFVHAPHVPKAPPAGLLDSVAKGNA